jgi:hypothetical protein
VTSRSLAPTALYGAGLRAASRGSTHGWWVRYADGSTRPLALADWVMPVWQALGLSVHERPGI